VRLAALDLRGISEADLGFWAGSWDSLDSRVHLNSRVSHFLYKCYLFCVNSVEFVFLMCIGIHVGHYPGHREHYLRKFSHFSDSSEMVDSGSVLGSSPGRSFLTPKSRVLTGLSRRVRNVRLAVLDLREIS